MLVTKAAGHVADTTIGPARVHPKVMMVRASQRNAEPFVLKTLSLAWQRRQPTRGIEVKGELKGFKALHSGEDKPRIGATMHREALKLTIAKANCSHRKRHTEKDTRQTEGMLPNEATTAS